MYSILFQMQALMMTPLADSYQNDNLEQFYQNINYFLVNFSFLPDSVVFTDSEQTKPQRMLFAQKNDYLDRIGLDSGSAIYNVGKLLFVW